MGAEAPAAKGKEPKQIKPKIDEAALKSEIAAFAASIGLGSGASSGFVIPDDDAFADFAPEVANKPLADSIKVEKSQGKNKKSEKQADATAQQGGKGKVKHSGDNEDKEEQAAPVKEHANDPIRGREWNFGVGPRPGTAWVHEDVHAWHAAAWCVCHTPMSTIVLPHDCCS